MKGTTSSTGRTYDPTAHYSNNVEEAIALAHDPRAIENGYRENLSKWQQIKGSRYVLLCAFAAAAGGFSFGFDQGLIAVVLGTRPFLDQFPQVDKDQNASASFWKGLMTAMLELGAFLGAVQSGWSSDKFSRRKTLFLGIIWFNIGAIIQIASYSYAQLVIGRLVGGVGVGTLAATAPMYIAETAPPNIRGFLLVTESWMIVFGCVVSYYVSYASKNIPNDWCFRVSFLVQVTPAIMLGAVFFFLPYSPRWLCLQGRDEEAHSTLARLRNLDRNHPLILAEYITIKADSDAQIASLAIRHPHLIGQKSFAKQLQLEAASWLDLFKPGAIKRSHIAIGLGFFQQFIGVNAVIYFGPALFEALGFDREMQLHMAGVMNIGQLVGISPVFWLLDTVGRRPLAIAGSAIVLVCHAVIGGLIGSYSDDWQSHRSAAWVCVALILIFMVVFGASWSPVPWAVPSEIFNSTLRAKGTALATCTIWLYCFIIGLVTPALIDQMNGAGSFVFFAVFSFLALVWTIYFVPETKGKTLEAIDEIFHDSSVREVRSLENECMQRACNDVRKNFNMESQPAATEYYRSDSSDEKKEKDEGLVTRTESA
ncbi:unnamed protein product [Sympodiomycopsis kandeliae]